MILTCPECRRRYRTDPKRIPPGGGFVRCPACKARIEVRAPEAETASLDIHTPPAPAPPPAAPPAPSAPETLPPVPSPAPPVSSAPPETPAEPEEAPPSVAPSPVESSAWAVEPPPSPAPEPEPEREEGVPAEEAPEPEREDGVPAEAPAPEEPPVRVSEPPEIFIRTHGGSYIARNLDELRKWIFEGRLLREDLISHAGGPEIPASEHPLTSMFFEAAAGDLMARPGADGSVAGAAGPPLAGEAVAALPPEAAAQGEEGWPSEQWPGEDAFMPAVPEELPRAGKAMGVFNLLLSLIDPIGLIAAIGLLLRRAWGRALTILWAVVRLLLIGGAIGVVLRQRGPSSPLGQIRASLPPEAWQPILIGAGLGTLAFLIYLIWVIIYLRREEIAARFKPGGARAAVILGLIGYLAIWFAAWQVRSDLRLQRAEQSRAPAVSPAPVVKAPPPAPPSAPAEIQEGRAFTFDGLASIDVAPGWRVLKITEGEQAKLGVLLEGTRDTPAGTLRLIAADPADLERQDQRFDTAAVRGRDIRGVEEVRRGEFTGRKVITAFPVEGGTTGYLTLSLHDPRRGYQFRCSAKGPDWSALQPDCEAMAASLLVSAPSGKPQSGPEAPAPPSPTKGSETLGQAQPAAPKPAPPAAAAPSPSAPPPPETGAPAAH